MLVVEENHSSATIVGAANLPNFQSLIRRGTVLANFFATTHPSLPNYLALVSGSTHGVTSDCTDCFVSAPNLADQFDTAGITWKVYAQGLPSPCSKVTKSGAYVRRHVPFFYFDSIRNAAPKCAHIVPYSEFASDARNDQLPTFALVIPDLEHDMHGVDDHDTPALQTAADQFIGTLDTTLRASKAWQHDTRLVVTWDEGGGYSPSPHSCCGGDANGGHIATFVVGPKFKPGTDIATYDHYALLRSIETLYGLEHLGGAAHDQSHDIAAITGA